MEASDRSIYAPLSVEFGELSDSLPLEPMAATEFPHDLLPLLRCSFDGEVLVESEVRSGSVGIVEARLECTACGSIYHIQDGIARMLRHDGLSPEDHHEITVRDMEYASTDGEAFVPPAASWRSELSDLVEIPPFLAALRPLKDCRLLEFGCGDGRLTMLMAQLAAQIMAVDFSLNALRRMAGWLPAGVAPTEFRVKAVRSGDLRPYVGLVQADASHFRVRPRSFHRAVSATPLDSREQRMAMYRTIADALTDDGWYLGSFEHDDLLRRLLGLPLARRYERGGIFIEHFAGETIKRESSPYFSKRRISRIRPKVPFVSRLPKMWSVRLLRAISRIPGLTHLGEIVLLKAKHPVRLPAEGVSRPGNRLVRTIFRWYTSKLGKRPVWGTDELVM